MKITGYSDTSKIQHNVLLAATAWVKHHKKPIPQKEILTILSNYCDDTVRSACRALERKGYLRKSIQQRNSYILLRTV